MYLRNAKWVVKGGELYILAQTASGRAYVKPKIRPYFFADKRAADYLKCEKGDYYSPDGRKLVKLSVDLPSEVPVLRNKLEKVGIPTYESDIVFVRRWMIDEGYTVSPEPSVAYIDIEVDCSKHFPLPSHPTERIISLAIVDSYGREQVYSYDDEEQMIADFLKKLLEYDIIAGWNIDSFDIPYLRSRCQKLGIKFDFNQLNWIDLLSTASKWGVLLDIAEYSLDGVAAALNVGRKIEVPPPISQTLLKWFKEEREKLKEYNLNDARLCLEIDRKLGITRTVAAIANRCRLFYRDVLSMHRIFENSFLISQLDRDIRICLPYRKYTEKVREKYQGAVILKPSMHIADNVIELDYTSLYPTIIMTFNAAIDSIGNDIGSPIGIKFSASRRSCIAEMLENMMKERLEYKKLAAEDEKYKFMQRAVKTIMAAVYGVIGDNTSRIYHKGVAAAITAYGRWILLKSMEIAGDLGYRVIYGDTDAIYILSNTSFDRAIEIAPELAREINSRLKEAILEEFNPPEKWYRIQLKVEDVFRRIAFPVTGAKKRYAAIRSKPPETLLPSHIRTKLGIAYVVGYKRTDTFPLERKFEFEVLKAMLEEGDIDRARERVSTLLSRTRELLYMRALDKLLIYRKRLSRLPYEYTVDQPYIRAAKRLWDMGKYRIGEPVEYVIVATRSGKIAVEPVVDGVIPKIRASGYDYYYKILRQAAERIIGSVGWGISAWLR